MNNIQTQLVVFAVYRVLSLLFFPLGFLGLLVLLPTKLPTFASIMHTIISLFSLSGLHKLLRILRLIFTTLRYPSLQRFHEQGILCFKWLITFFNKRRDKRLSFFYSFFSSSRRFVPGLHMCVMFLGEAHFAYCNQNSDTK